MSNRYLFQCPVHGENWEENSGACEICAGFVNKAKENKRISDETERQAKLRESVYWPTEMGHMGRTIENLGDKPVHFSEKRKYRDHLKRHNIREAG